MEYIPTTFPTYVSYGNYLFEIAKLLVRHHETTLESTTPFTRYQQVLDFDAKMRDLATKGMPRYFHVVEPVDAMWPEWVQWARSSLTISFAHKIIMIHRNCISQSFTNTAYAFTRMTCVAAAKTILNESNKAKSMNGPIIKAFSVAAALVLCLDIAHRSEADGELAVHRNLVVECVEQLLRFSNSVLATRRANILTTILDSDVPWNGRNPSAVTAAQLEEFISVICESRDIPSSSVSSSIELFAPPMGISNKFLFEGLLGLRIT